jgi:hypothetical protein
MKKLFITEEEKNRILNLHKKLIKEDIGCPCKDGTTSEECCEKTNQIKTELTPEQKEVYSLIIKEMYEATQQMFSDMGVEKLLVWRGASTTDEDFKKILADKAESDDWSQPIIPERVDTRPISSWSTSVSIASSFSDGHLGTEGYLVARMLDVKNILGTAFTGFGSSIEQEIIQLATLVGEKQPITVLSPSLTAIERARQGKRRPNSIEDVLDLAEEREQYLLTIKNNLTNYVITS